MDSIKTVLEKFNPVVDKYISREYQSYGIDLAEKLDDYNHRALYIKLAKNINRAILERALSFCIDSQAKNKGALFMWKLRELGVFKKKIQKTARQKSKDKEELS